jgi:hypothetical protein
LSSEGILEEVKEDTYDDWESEKKVKVRNLEVDWEEDVGDSCCWGTRTVDIGMDCVWKIRGGV